MVKSAKASFEKKTLSIVHLLHPYVKQRLIVAQNLGILPKNMFKSNEIIDEVILNVYENNIDKSIDINDLRLVMFGVANKKLLNLFEKEKWHKNSISTKIILEEELRLLEENFTIDAGNELIMDEDLEDISYHQKDNTYHLLSNEGYQENVLELLDIEDNAIFDKRENKTTLQKMYDLLPLQTSNVMDLYILGKLNLREISNILEVEILEVKRIIEFVKENFKKYLN